MLLRAAVSVILALTLTSVSTLADTMDVRLGYPGAPGQLIVTINGKTGGVCSDGATDAVAKVVCRQLGLQTEEARFSQSVNGHYKSFVVSDVHCTGEEKDLANCTFEVDDPLCPQWYFVYIECGPGPKEPPSDISVAIEGGGHRGKLFATVNGRVTGYVTATWSLQLDNIAVVACRELGWNVTKTLFHRRNVIPYKTQETPVVLGKVNCTGEESRLMECTHTFAWTSGNSIDIECREISAAIEGGGRNGTLLVTYNGKTGLACEDGVNNAVARVVCQQLGWNTTWAHITPLTTSTTLPIALGHAYCSTYKERLENCELSSPKCRGTGVGISCPSEPPEVKVSLEGGGTWGRLLVTVSGKTGTVCHTSHNRNIAEVVCRELGFNTKQPSARYYDAPTLFIMMGRVACTGNETRLGDCDFTTPSDCYLEIEVNCSPAPTTITPVIEGGGPVGRLLAIVDGQIGKVCKPFSFYHHNTIKVACKELGWDTTSTRYSYTPASNKYPVKLRVDKCTGNEERLIDCVHAAEHVCEDREKWDLTIDCTPDNEIETEDGGPTGRLYVRVGGQFGTVCNTGVKKAVAVVACRQLGWVTSKAKIKKVKKARGRDKRMVRVVMDNVVCTGKENSLQDCTYSTENTCSHSQDIAVDCSKAPVSMTVKLHQGGLKGRLVLNLNGDKTHVCNDGATHAIAKVVCREMGFNSSWPRIYPAPGFLTASVPSKMIDEVRCSGSESRLAECEYTMNHNCMPDEAIGVDCSDEEGPASDVTFRIDNDYLYATINASKRLVRLFGASNDMVVTACRNLGFNTTTATTSWGDTHSWQCFAYNAYCTGKESSITECEFTTDNMCLLSKVTKLHCTSDPAATQVPLEPKKVHVPMNVTVAIEGYGPMGRLVATVNGHSGQIGVSILSNAIAAVACRELGWNTTIAHLRKFVYTSTFQVLSDVYCTGNESKLADCVYTYSEFAGGRAYDLGIDCSPELAVTVALSGNERKGRLIAKVNGVSGYVCSKGATDALGAVVCRELGWNASSTGITEVTSMKPWYFWLPVVMHDVYCTGHETTLANCTFTIFGDCPSSNIVAVYCDEGTKINVALESPKQVPSFYAKRTKRAVDMTLDSTPSITDLKRINDKPRQTLLVNFNGIVKSVCYQGTEKKAVAQVVCRGLGEHTPRARLITRDYMSPDWYIRAELESCSGNETRLAECTFKEGHRCTVDDNVVALCFPVPTFSIEGGGPRGRLIVTMNSMTGTVCSSIANDALASVVCRELGYNTDKAEILHLNHGSSKPILLDDAHCTGTEDKVADCRYEEAESDCYYNSRYNPHPTYRKQDIEINCSPGPTKINVAIEGGGRKGRLLVTVDGKRGTVCNDGATHELAAVVCRELGLDTPMARITNVWAPSTLPILLNQVNCSGTESDLAHCQYRTIHSCSHIEDVGVDCSPAPTVTVAIEGRRRSREGRLLATVNGRTGTVCDDRATHAVAKVVCRELRRKTNEPEIIRSSTSTTLPIVMDEVQCTGNEKKLSECRFITNHNCKHSEDIAVRCPRKTRIPW